MGNVVRADAVAHTDTGRSKGWGTVLFETPEQARCCRARPSLQQPCLFLPYRFEATLSLIGPHRPLLIPQAQAAIAGFNGVALEGRPMQIKIDRL